MANVIALVQKHPSLNTNNERLNVPNTSSTQQQKQPRRRKATYRKEARNAKAVVQAMAWLKAAGIPARRSTALGCDLTVQARDGHSVEVRIGIDHDEPRPYIKHVFLLACELTSRHHATSLKAFQALTDALGYGAMAKPIDRGPEPTKKLMYDDNFELVAMRHKEFRKVPNPTAAELMQYDKVIDKAIHRFMFINSKICRRHVLQFEDLKTYAQIWTCNYLGLYKVQDPQNNDNERKLYAHLCQRFGNFIEVFLKKEANCIVDSETVSVALFGRPTTPKKGRRATVADLADLGAFDSLDEDVIEDEEIEFDETFNPELALVMLTPEEEAAEEEAERQVSEAQRRKAAQKTLAEALGAMSHEDLLTTLTEVAESPHVSYGAQAEAKRQLRLHRQSCTSCSQVDEEVTGADALSG